ncbi:hypothetical protein Tco_1101975 [Tanacetum coccineum]
MLLQYQRKITNQKFQRSLPSSWSQIALIMRNKQDIDQSDIDDLYLNLRLVLPSGYFRVITVGGIVQQARPVLSTPDDLEELDIRWKVAMMTVRLQCLRKGHFAMEGKSGKEPGKSIYGVKARGMQQQNEPSHKHLWHKIVLIGYAGAMILIEHS